MSYLPPLKVGRIGDPDISLATYIKNPCDPVHAGRGSQPGRKRRAHDLFKSEALSLSRLSGRRNAAQQPRGKKQVERFHKHSIILAAGILAAGSWLPASRASNSTRSALSLGLQELIGGAKHPS